LHLIVPPLPAATQPSGQWRPSELEKDRTAVFRSARAKRRMVRYLVRCQRFTKPTELEHAHNLANQMIARHRIVEIKRIEQLLLVPIGDLSDADADTN
jgi:hypothetical protein